MIIYILDKSVKFCLHQLASFEQKSGEFLDIINHITIIIIILRTLLFVNQQYTAKEFCSFQFFLSLFITKINK